LQNKPSHLLGQFRFVLSNGSAQVLTLKVGDVRTTYKRLVLVPMSATSSDSILLGDGLLGTIVGVVALLYPWYSWWRKRLDRNARLIDEVRV